MFSGTDRKPSLLARSTAVAGILLVLALTVLASSPDLHERLHARDAATPATSHHAGATALDDDDGCVVTLFAQGIILALALFALAFTGQVLRLADFTVFDRISPESPSYLLQPTQAPPLGLS
ncbi:MAG TPA: hypothetical protein VIJ19_07195 [Opitutaceae bacterium]